MAASLDQRADTALADALAKRKAKDAADSAHADALLRYLRDGRDAGWSWKRISIPLGISAKAVETYWMRNRLRAGRLGDAPQG